MFTPFLLLKQLCVLLVSNAHTQPFVWHLRICDLDQIPLLHCSVIQFWCSVPIFDTFSCRKGSTGAPWLICSYVAPYTVNHDVLFILTLLPKLAWTFSCNWSFGSDNMGQTLFLVCISEPWPLVTVSQIHYYSFLCPVLTTETRDTPQELQLQRGLPQFSSDHKLALHNLFDYFSCFSFQYKNLHFSNDESVIKRLCTNKYINAVIRLLFVTPIWMLKSPKITTFRTEL